MTREPCGCTHDGGAWLKLCAPHAAEHNERHLRAAYEKSSAELLGCYYLVPESRGIAKQE